MDADKLQEIRAKHADAQVLRSKGGEAEIVVRPPTRPEWRRFMSEQRKKQDGALETLLLSCILYPDRPGYEAIFDRRPGLVEAWGGKLLEIAGLDEVQSEPA